MMKFRRFLTKKYIISVAILLLLIVIIMMVAKGNGKAQIVRVERGEVVQEVVVTGKAVAQNEVDLGFDTSGRVARSFAIVGERVAQGATIALLDTGEVVANLAKERALLAEEEATLGGEEEKLVSSMSEAYAVADNAVRNKTDQFFKTPRTNPIFEVKFSDGNYVHYFEVPSNTVMDLNNTRREVEIVLNKWQSELLQINPTNVVSFSTEVVNRLNLISSFLNTVAYAVNSFTPAEYAYESTVTGYKTAVDLARTNVDSIRSTVITDKERLVSQKSGNLNSAGQARVNQIKSSISALESSLAKSRITAPFTGTITRQDAKVGEIAKSGEPLITLISESDMYIEANISEINIGKVNLDNNVKLEFDAYPGEVFLGKVVFIDPGETVVDEVVNYKIRIEPEAFDKRIKSGLTGSVHIAAGEKENVLFIPIYTTFKEEDKIYVNKLVDREVQKVEIQTGLVGSDGKIEVLSGLNEGDTVEILK